MSRPEPITPDDHRPTATPSVPGPDPAPAKHEGDPLTDPSPEPAARGEGVGGAGEEPPPADPSAPDPPGDAADAAVPGEGAPTADVDTVAEGTSPDAAVPVEPSDAERAGQYLALAQRTQADFENFRKRAAREVRAAEARGVSKAARELLPALDHLALALDNLEGPALEGIRLVQRELLGVLGRLGIEAYSPKGEAFDPQVHEAVSQVAVEGVEAGTVFEVMQNGYRHGEAVLRPARVVVAG